MANDDGRERFRFHSLRFSSCTPEQVEGRAREVLQAWLEHRAERKALEREKRIGFESGTVATMSRLFLHVLPEEGGTFASWDGRTGESRPVRFEPVAGGGMGSRIGGLEAFGPQ